MNSKRRGYYRRQGNLIEVVVGVTHNELIFQPGDINFVDGTNQLKTSQAAQWDREMRLKKRFDANPVNHRI